MHGTSTGADLNAPEQISLHRGGGPHRRGEDQPGATPGRTCRGAAIAGEAAGQSFPGELLSGSGALRPAYPVVLPVPAHQRGARYGADGLVPEPYRLRLPVREGCAVRAPDPERRRIQAVPDHLQGIGATSTGAGPGDLSAGTHLHAGRARAATRESV